MFEKILEEKKNKIVEKIELKADFIFLNDLFDNDLIDDYIKKFFVAEVNFRIYEQQKNRLLDKNIDYTAEELKDILKQIDDISIKYSRFQAAKIIEKIKNAVALKCNFLCRPRTTMRSFIFGYLTSVPFDYFKLKMNYFIDYYYFRENVFSNYNRMLNINPFDNTIHIVEFEKVIEEIDNGHISQFTPEEFLDFLNPIFEFFNEESDINENTTVPIEALIIFFDEKGLKNIVNKLTLLLKDKQKKNISQKELLIIFRNSILELREKNIQEFIELNKIKNQEQEPEIVISPELLNDNDYLANDILSTVIYDFGKYEFSQNEILFSDNLSSTNLINDFLTDSKE